MAESWGDWFTRVGQATVKGIEVLSAVTSRVEMAFDANQTRGAGMIWLPRANQVLYYQINWSHDLDLRGKTAFEIQLLNVFLGLTMWEGLTNVHRVARNPVIKVGCIDFTYYDNYDGTGESGRRVSLDDDVSALWTKVSNCINGICPTGDNEDKKACWEYVSPNQYGPRRDEKFAQVVRLMNGQELITNSEGITGFGLTRWDPRQTFKAVLPIVPAKYVK